MTAPVQALAVEAVTEANPYLAGVYAPVVEEVTSAELEVIGEIPADLHGVYARIGPNPRLAPVGRYHWFDGDGMVHSMHFEGGRATYRNRWVRTRAFQRELAANRPLWTGVMEDPRGNPSDMWLKDSANTTLNVFDDKLIALWYLCGQPYEIDPSTLDTIGPTNFGGTLDSLMSAHPKVDEQTGELFFFQYGATTPYLRYGVVAPGGRVSHRVDIDLPGPRLPHDMALSENHAILMDLPLYNDPAAAARGRHKLFFDRERPARFGLIGRHAPGESIRWFEAAPCYIYHVVGAWEEGPEVVLDVCRVKRPEPATTATGPLAKLLSYLRLDAQMYRYRFNLVTGATSEGPVDDRNTEFPTIDARLVGHRSRYSYTVHISPEDTLLFDGLVKYDNVTGTTQTHDFGPGRWGSEAPFAPRPGSTGEDDGYLLSFVHDEGTGRSEVLVLDARDLAAGPVARILVPHRVPVGFHAAWVPGESLPDHR